MLEQVHTSHPGIHHMVELARSHVWWPGIDWDIDPLVRACTACLEVKHAPAADTLVPIIATLAEEVQPAVPVLVGLFPFALCNPKH